MDFLSLNSRSKNYIVFLFIMMLALFFLFYSNILKPGGLIRKYTVNQSKRQGDIKQLLNSNTTAMDNPFLVDVVIKDWIFPPSKLPYALAASNKEDYSQLGESKQLDTLMGEKSGGFFIECGASDGETLSVSLFLEKVRGWSGLLIEANPKSFAKLQTKNGKAHSSGTCLSTVKHPEKVQFQNARELGGIQKALTDQHQKRIDRERFREDVVEVQCFPLYTMLLALGLPTVDLFSLDVEGAEADVLKTIPFEKVQINWIYVEHNYKQKNKHEISNVLLNNGYEHVKEFHYNSIYRLKIAN